LVVFVFVLVSVSVDHAAGLAVSQLPQSGTMLECRAKRVNFPFSRVAGQFEFVLKGRGFRGCGKLTNAGWPSF
jgi:hypothetical protein